MYGSPDSSSTAAHMPAITNYFKPANGAAVAISPVPTAARQTRTRTTLSSAARVAIIEAKEEQEPAAKRARKTPTKITKVTETSTISIPRATTRDELRKSLADHPTILPLLELELDTLGEDWLISLQDELTKPYFLKKFVVEEQKTKQIFPPAADIYSWSRFCPLKDVRVIIVGQDPYHDDGQAHGLAFSVRKGVRIPPSLRNMYKEMEAAVPGFVAPKHGDLTQWAEHGVLLLNTALSVRAHQANSHSGQGWEIFTAAVLKVVTDRLATDAGANGLVIMAWGAHAAKMIAGLNTTKHLVLKSAHPSPLSASRGFFGNGHFVKSNEWLRERYGENGGIDWKSLGVNTE